MFDLDGTLVDSLPDIAGALNHSLRALDLAPIDLAVVAQLVGDGVKALAERALALQSSRSPVSAADLAATILARQRAVPCHQTRPYPGMEQALDALGQAGATLAVVTNKSGAVARAIVETLGWSRHFSAVLGDGDGHPRKPDPRIGLALLARHALRPAEVLMVGDGLPDLAFARALGCPVAAVTWGYTDRQRLLVERPDHLLDDRRDLLKVFGPVQEDRLG